jgi:hypothetical protein
MDVEPAAATTAERQARLLEGLHELAAKQNELRAMLIELQQRPNNSR